MLDKQIYKKRKENWTLILLLASNVIKVKVFLNNKKKLYFVHSLPVVYYSTLLHTTQSSLCTFFKNYSKAEKWTILFFCVGLYGIVKREKKTLLRKNCMAVSYLKLFLSYNHSNHLRLYSSRELKKSLNFCLLANVFMETFHFKFGTMRDDWRETNAQWNIKIF